MSLFIPRDLFDNDSYYSYFRIINHNIDFILNYTEPIPTLSFTLLDNPLFYYNYKYYPPLPYVRKVVMGLKKLLNINSIISPYLDPSLKRISFSFSFI